MKTLRAVLLERQLPQLQVLILRLLGGVRTGVITILITLLRGLINPLITTHDPSPGRKSFSSELFGPRGPR